MPEVVKIFDEHQAAATLPDSSAEFVGGEVKLIQSDNVFNPPSYFRTDCSMDPVSCPALGLNRARVSGETRKRSHRCEAVRAPESALPQDAVVFCGKLDVYKDTIQAPIKTPPLNLPSTNVPA
ncbi:hypothetical protein HY407_03945 [Candidatus Gottesmanbacteria bacterium]|nr:hypothetical protein [Candidatus Gottesmanbacteria bacterium]